MKKIGVVFEGCIHNNTMINHFIENSKNNDIEFVDDILKADYILYVSCACQGKIIEREIEMLSDILSVKNQLRPELDIIVVGCLTKMLEEDDELTIIKNQEWLIPLNNYINSKNNKNSLNSRINNRTLKIDNGVVTIFNIVNGCINNCSFCKKNYLGFPLKSLPFNACLSHIKKLVDDGSRKIVLGGDCLVSYGIDLPEKRQRLEELLMSIHDLEKLNSIELNTLVPGNAKRELIKRISDLEKIHKVCLHLETASNRLLKLMNRPYDMKQLDECVQLLNNGNKRLSSCLMAGFPTETYKDMDMTLKYIIDNKIYIIDIFPYSDYELLPSHKLKQYSKEEINEHYKYMKEVIDKNNKLINESMIGSEEELIYYKTENGIHYFASDLFQMVTSESDLYANYTPGTVVKTKIKDYNTKKGFVI